MKKWVVVFAAVLVCGCQTAAPPQVAPGPAAAAAAPLQPVRSRRPLSDFEIAQRDYANETADVGTARFTSLIPTAFAAPTPLLMPGARRLTTTQLLALLQRADSGAVLINVQPVGAGAAELIDGAVWLSGAGEYGTLDDDTQQRYAERLQTLTGGDKKRAIVLYCTDPRCWHVYNAGTRALVLGYRKVHWYRGGLRAWYEAGLPTARSDADRW